MILMSSSTYHFTNKFTKTHQRIGTSTKDTTTERTGTQLRLSSDSTIVQSTHRYLFRDLICSLKIGICLLGLCIDLPAVVYYLQHPFIPRTNERTLSW
jgi:hypothetical protein